MSDNLVPGKMEAANLFFKAEELLGENNRLIAVFLRTYVAKRTDSACNICRIVDN